MEQEGSAILDLDKLFPGSWSRMAIVCFGATRAELTDALGFEWQDSPNLDSPGFFAMIVLFDGERVIEHFNFGQNDFEEDLYVDPCPRRSVDDEIDRTLALVERASAQVEFTYIPAEPGNLWYVTESEFNRLSRDD